MRLEFYKSGTDKLVAALDDSSYPPVEAYVNIAKKTYRVTSVTFAVDNAHDTYERPSLRVNINVVEEA